jgi:hypothetical protein
MNVSTDNEDAEAAAPRRRGCKIIGSLRALTTWLATA